MSNDHDPLDRSAWFNARVSEAKERRDRQTREERHRQKLLEGKVMTQAQANEIASRLDEMITRRASLVRGRKAELVPHMPDTKELHRLRLPPGADPQKRRVRLSLGKYREVVRNLAKISGEDPDDMLYELVQGTAYESAKASAIDWARHNTIMSTINATLSRLDRKFSWSSLYERTANLRLKNGVKCTWPLSVAAYYDGDLDEEMAKALVDPLQVFSIQNSVSPMGNRPALQNYFNGHILLDESFFHVPHALVGHVCIWDLDEADQGPAEHNVQRYSQIKGRREDEWDLKLPNDDWDEASLSPKGQLLNLKYAGLDHPFWLVAYPDPISLRPVPALYQPIDLSGDAFLAPLNRLTLGAVADAVWLDRSRDSTLAERLLELVTEDETGVTPLESAWERTGSWLQHNPVLKAHRNDQEKLRQIYASAMRRRGQD